MTDANGPMSPRRRLFAQRALGEALSFIAEMRGQPQRRLSELGSLPPEKLALLAGAVRSDVELAVSADSIAVVTRAPDGSAHERPAMARTDANLAVFNRLHGKRTLGEIAGEVAQELGWERERALAHTADLFLNLVRAGICLPTNVVD